MYDASGQFVSGLKPSALAALEDGRPRRVQELTEHPIGAQIVVGVNPGSALDVRDAEGVTRYQRVQQMLGTWATALQARQAEETETADNLSLVTIAGPLIAHTTPEAWLASFTAFQPEFRATTPNIQSLALSLDAALASTPQVGMKRAILFITPHMEDPQLEAALKHHWKTRSGIPHAHQHLAGGWRAIFLASQCAALPVACRADGRRVYGFFGTRGAAGS